MHLVDGVFEPLTVGQAGEEVHAGAAPFGGPPPRPHTSLPVHVRHVFQNCIQFTIPINLSKLNASVPDPDPPDPRVFWPPGPGSGSTCQRYGSGSGSGSGSFYHNAKIIRKTWNPTILRLILTFYL